MTVAGGHPTSEDLPADKWLLLTGANGGIGRALVNHLSTLGYRGVAVDLSKGLHDVPPGWRYAPCDVADEDALTAIVRSAAEVDGPPWGLVNAAGTLGTGEQLMSISTESWNTVLRTNLTGSLIASRVVAREVSDSGSPGSIVLIGSQLGSVVASANHHYAVSKAAVIHLSRALAVELAPVGIRVNSVSPGIVNTPMIRDPDDPVWLADRTRRIPLGRIARAEEIGPAVALCLDPRNSYMTGSDVVVDGGYLVL